MTNEPEANTGFIQAIARKLTPKPALVEPPARLKAIATLRRELNRLPASPRSRLSDLSGLAEDIVRDFERGTDIGDTYTRLLVPFLFDRMKLDEAWNFAADPDSQINWNMAPPKPPRDPLIKIDALADLLNEEAFDHVVTLPEVLDVAGLNLLSKLYSRTDEQMVFDAAGDEQVMTRDVAPFLRLYIKRVSETAGFATMVSGLDYLISYQGNAAAQLDSCSTTLANKGVYSKTPAGRWLAGKEGAAIVRYRAINEAMKRPRVQHKFIVTPELVKEQVAFVLDAIEGKNSITVPLKDAATVVLARCVVSE